MKTCNFKLGYNISKVMSDYYPERLNAVICLNHNRVFHGVWIALRKILPAKGVAKVKLVRSKEKMNDVFARYFDLELSDWLMTEITLNKQIPLSESQRHFWKPPENVACFENIHDPRGCPTYVSKYLDRLQNCETFYQNHLPHPIILSYVRGKNIIPVALTDEELQELKLVEDTVSTSDGDIELDDDLNVCEESL